MLFYWRVFSGNGCEADGVVLADNEEEALEKVKNKYDSKFLKVELDEDSGINIKEDENIKGLYVRWED